MARRKPSERERPRRWRGEKRRGKKELRRYELSNVVVKQRLIDGRMR